MVAHTTPIAYSAVRGAVTNVMVQYYPNDITVVTRLPKSIGTTNRAASYGHLLDITFFIPGKCAVGDLVAVYSLPDIVNQNVLHYNLNGLGSNAQPVEPTPADPSQDGTYLLRNTFPAGSYAYIQDEDVDRTKADISRASFYFEYPHGVSLYAPGSVMIPLTVSGTGAKQPSAEAAETAETAESAESAEEGKHYDLDRTTQNLGIFLERSENGLFWVNNKMWARIGGVRRRLAHMMTRPHHIFYFNNTKENKGNMNLKLIVNLVKSKLPIPLTLLSLERVESLTGRYIVRIQNQAEFDDAYQMNDNVVVHDMTSIAKFFKLGVRSCSLSDPSRRSRSSICSA